MTLSIVTINKNNENGLARTMRSLEKLSDQEFYELIFVDGASSDNSVNIAKALWRSENIISEEDNGIYHAMNKGLNAANNKYIVWLNSGDIFCGEDLTLINSTVENSKADVIVANIQVIDEKTGVTSRVWMPDLNDPRTGNFPHPGCFFRRTRLLELGGYDETLKYAGDKDLMLRLIKEDTKVQLLNTLFSGFYTGGVSESVSAHLESLEVGRRHGKINIVKYGWLSLRYRYEPVLGPLKRFFFGGG